MNYAYINIKDYSKAIKLPCKMFRSNGELGNVSLFFEKKDWEKYKDFIEHLGVNARHDTINKTLCVLTFPINSFLSILVE